MFGNIRPLFFHPTDEADESPDPSLVLLTWVQSATGN